MARPNVRTCQRRLWGEAVLWLAVRAVRYCSCVMRENTPGGSFPSPSAARRPSCCRARTSATSAWNVRGSVMARSLSTRRFNCTLHCGRLHTKHQVFNNIYTPLHFIYLWCSIFKIIPYHAARDPNVSEFCNRLIRRRRTCALFLSSISVLRPARLSPSFGWILDKSFVRNFSHWQRYWL